MALRFLKVEFMVNSFLEPELDGEIGHRGSKE